MIELDQMKQKLLTYEEPLAEVKASLDLESKKKRIEELDLLIEDLQTQLQSEEVTSDYEKLIELTQRLEELQNEQAGVYALWEELME